MSEERFSLKDHLFNREKVDLLAGWMRAADPRFDSAGFAEQVVSRFPELELKQRIDWIADCLQERLPEEFSSTAALIRAALPPPLDPTKSDDDFGDFIIAPFGVVVERRGLDAPDQALDLFEELTQRFSMELSIRAFLNRWPEEVLARMDLWAEHPHYHVRRLVSEGTRPRLPWAASISLEPERALPLLDRLHADPTRYVTRSVANHLNDIARKSPETVVERLSRWKDEGRQDQKEFAWMARHALRGLVRSGDARALEFLGYAADAEIALLSLEVPERVEIGGVMNLNVILKATEDTPVIVDFVVDFVKANGARAGKVFRLKDTVLPAGREVTLAKAHRFKANATTFRLYPGRHAVAIHVNGRCVGSAEFDLIDGDGPARTE